MSTHEEINQQQIKLAMQILVIAPMQAYLDKEKARMEARKKFRATPKGKEQTKEICKIFGVSPDYFIIDDV